MDNPEVDVEVAQATKKPLQVESDELMFLLEEDQERYTAAGLPLQGGYKEMLSIFADK